MLKDDIRNLLHTQEDNFSVLLMRLYQKADMVNKAKIRRGWPNLAAVVDAWQAGPDTDEHGWDHVPDLPYDGPTRDPAHPEDDPVRELRVWDTNGDIMRSVFLAEDNFRFDFHYPIYGVLGVQVARPEDAARQ